MTTKLKNNIYFAVSRHIKFTDECEFGECLDKLKPSRDHFLKLCNKLKMFDLSKMIIKSFGDAIRRTSRNKIC